VPSVRHYGVTLCKEVDKDANGHRGGQRRDCKCKPDQWRCVAEFMFHMNLRELASMSKVLVDTTDAWLA
jgi:hypothetical protein